MNIIKKPRLAILGTFDATSYTGNLWDRHGSGVTNFTTSVNALPNGESHFDIIAFLNGYGSRSGDDLNSLWDISSLSQVTNISSGIDENGRFYLMANKPIKITTSATDNRAKFGYAGTETSVDQGGGVYHLTATNRWQRGVFEIDIKTGQEGLSITHVTGSVNFTADDSPPRYDYSTTRVALRFTLSEMNVSQSNAIQAGDIWQDFDGLEWEVESNTAMSGGSFIVFNAFGHSQAFPTDNTIYQITQDVSDIIPHSIRAQNLPTLLRKRGYVGGLDDIYQTNCLENSDFVSGKKIRWILEADGKVSVNFEKDLVPFETFINATATGKALLKRLGFDSTETYVEDVVGGISRIKANNVAPCVLIADRGYTELRREVTGRDEFSMMANGSVVSSGLLPVKGWRLVMRVLGPAYGYLQNRELHLQRWWKYARSGLTIYPSFGDGDRPLTGGNDTRRHIDLIEIFDAQSYAERLIETPDADRQENHFGKRVGGRLLVRRHPADAQARRESYSGDLDVFQEISFRLLDDPSR